MWPVGILLKNQIPHAFLNIIIKINIFLVLIAENLYFSGSHVRTYFALRSGILFKFPNEVSVKCKLWEIARKQME